MQTPLLKLGPGGDYVREYPRVDRPQQQRHTLLISVTGTPDQLDQALKTVRHIEWLGCDIETGLIQ